MVDAKQGCHGIDSWWRIRATVWVGAIQIPQLALAF
jgi:hypothetical protein